MRRENIKSAWKQLGLLGLVCLALVGGWSCGGVTTPSPTSTEVQLPTETASLAVSTPTPSETPTPPPTPTPTEVPQPVIHIVQEGDTLNSIAKRYGTTVKAIAEANEIADPNVIAVGQELIIPIEETSMVTVTPSPPSPTPLVQVSPTSPSFGPIVFSDGIAADYRPTNPRTRFPVGTPRIYACFDFEKMSESVSWTYTWYQDGKELWTETDNWWWGEKGPFFVRYHDYLPKGSYELKLYIDGVLQQSASFVVE